MAEVLEGVVTHINERGIKLDNGRWLNFSRFVEVPRPMPGQQVRVQVQGRWLRALEVLDNATALAPRRNAPRPSEAACIAALQAAAAIYSGRDVSADDVLDMARLLLDWIVRNTHGA